TGTVFNWRVGGHSANHLAVASDGTPSRVYLILPEAWAHLEQNTMMSGVRIEFEVTSRDDQYVSRVTRIILDDGISIGKADAHLQRIAAADRDLTPATFQPGNELRRG